MAETLAVLSVAANVVQFVDFTARIISVGYEAGKAGHEGLKANVLIRNVNNDLRKIVDDLEKSLQQQKNELRTQNQLELLELAGQCKEIASELFVALESLKMNADSRRQIAFLGKKREWCGWENFRTALKTVWREDEIKSLEHKVNTFRQQLVLRILVSLRDEMNSSHSTQSSIRDDINRIGHTNEGLGEKLLSHISESKRWRADLINAIHQEHSSSNNRDISSITNHQREMLQDSFLNQLKFAEMEARENRIAEAHEKTFQWIYKDPQSGSTPWPNFVEWLESGSGFYWITGKAGSGKSTLAKFIYNDDRTLEALSRWRSDIPLATAAFFFWNSGYSIQMSQIGLLRSIMHQLLEKHPDLIPSLFPERWEAYSLFSNDPHGWSQEELRKAFKLLAKEDPAKRSYCLFIDGLDEFDGDHSDLNNLLKDVAFSPHIKICVSSRPWNVFEDAFGQTSTIMLQDLTSADIQSYVTSNFEGNTRFVELQKREPGYAKKLANKVAEKSAGVFLWVHLVVRSLLEGLVNGDRVSDLEARLALLPPDLEDLYHKMLHSLDPFYQSHASQLFQLIRVAIGVPTLLIMSFADEEPKLVYEYAVQPLTNNARILRADIMKRRLNSRCKGLLEAGSTSDINARSEPASKDLATASVQYLHRTVKEFLDQPTVWAKLVEWGPNGFNPKVNLCRGYISHIKHVDPKTQGKSEFWGAVTTCLTYAKADNEAPDKSLNNLLDELGDSLTQLATSASIDGQHFMSAYPYCAPQDSSYYQPNTLRGGKINWGHLILLLAMKYNLDYYVKARLDGEHYMHQNPSLGRLLMDSVLLRIIFGDLFSINTILNLNIITFLLAHGANPNWPFKPKTAWQHLLEEAKAMSDSETDPVQRDRPGAFRRSGVGMIETSHLGVRCTCMSHLTDDWIEAIYLFLAHGADPKTDLEKLLGLSFFGASRTEVQVITRKGSMKSLLGFGKYFRISERS